VEKRIAEALQIAKEHTNEDGRHHLKHAIDQMVRALTACPMEIQTALNCRGEPYEYQGYGESDAYKEFVASTHGEWGIGIPG